MKKALSVLLLLCLAVGLCACSGKGGLKLDDITDETLADYVSSEAVFAKYKTLSWERTQGTGEYESTMAVQLVKTGDVWLASSAGTLDTEGTMGYYTTEYTEENGSFEYNLTKGEDYNFGTFSIVADQCDPSVSAEVLWYLSVQPGGTITDKQEADGSAVITTSQPLEGTEYTIRCTYTLDMKNGQLTQCVVEAVDGSGQIIPQVTTTHFVYDGDTKLDTTAKDELTQGDDLCHATFIMVAEDGTTHSRTATVKQGNGGGSTCPDGYQIKFYSDAECTEEVYMDLEGEEATYYCKLVESEW